jgi:CHAD domain-containing protein
MGKKPALHPEHGVAKVLRQVAVDILGEVRVSLNHPSKTDAAIIHDYRKEQKRWRALLRLLGPTLGEEGRKLRIEARDLARELAGPRDAQSALDALEDAMEEKDAHDVLSPRSVRTLTERLEKSKTSIEVAKLTAKRRERLVEALDRAGNSIAQWPIDEMTFRDVADRMTAAYRRAKKMQPDDWATATPEALHELRQSVVIHRYQMELVEPLWPRLGRTWIEEAQRLRNRLGQYQDLTVLAALTEPHQILAPWRSRLLPLIAQRQADHVETAERISGRLFAEPPKAFRKRMEALWSASGGDD